MMLQSLVTKQYHTTLMIMAGGTGGHVYPAMAVADYLHAEGWRIVWLATEGGMENRLIADKPYNKAMIDMKGVRGKGLAGWLWLPIKLGLACKQSADAFRTYQPDVVLGMGGFAAFPGGLTAKLFKKPLVIHEQNSIAGLSNKVLRYLANQALVAFPAVFAGKALLVGNPVRADITQLDDPALRYGTRLGKLKLLIVGGSLGAAALNEILPKALATLPVEARPEVVHQAGEKQITALEKNYQQAGVNADTKAYIEDMAAMYAWADLVICRAGALTIAELACVGVASVLVPFPHAVDDHQTENARYLSDHGAAELIQQSEFNIARVGRLLRDINREQCLKMALKAKSLAKPNATAEVARICKAMATGVLV